MRTSLKEFLKKTARYIGSWRIDPENDPIPPGMVMKSTGEVIPWPLDAEHVPMVSQGLGGVSQGDVEVASDLTGANPTITVPTGEVWEITGVQLEFLMDINAGNRNVGFIIRDIGPLGLVTAMNSFEASTILLTLGQEGQFFFGNSKDHITNTNGVTATVADENPFPLTLSEGALLFATNDNPKATDASSIRVKYRRRA